MEKQIEIWKQIEDFQNYEISNLGRVRSSNRIHTHFIMKQIVNKKGYYTVDLFIGKPGKRIQRFRVSRLVACAFIPNPDNLPQVDHINGDKSNNSVENLQWIDPKKNVQKSQSYYYKTWKNDNPEEVFEFNSRLELEWFITRKAGREKKVNLGNCISKGAQNRLGWIIETNKIPGESFKK